MAAEVELNIDIGDGVRNLNDLAASAESLETKVQGVDSALDRLKEALGGLIEAGGGGATVFRAFLDIISGAGWEAGTSNVSKLREVVRGLKSEYTGLGPAEDEAVRASGALVTVIDQQDRSVQQLLNRYKSLEAQLQSGALKNVNLPRLTTETGQFLDQSGLTAEQRRSVAGGLLNVQAAQRDRQIETALDQRGTSDEATRQKEITAAFEQAEKERENIRDAGLNAIAATYAQETKAAEKAGEEQVASDNASISKRIEAHNNYLKGVADREAAMQAALDRQALASASTREEKIEVKRAQALRGVADPERIQQINTNADQELAQERERIAEQEGLEILRIQAKSGRQLIAEQVRINQERIREAQRAEEQLVALEDKAALAGTKGATRVNVQRGIELRGETDPDRISRINASYDKLAAAAPPEPGQPGTGGSFARLGRGAVQAGIGIGALDFRSYYVLSALQNLNSGAGEKTISQLPVIGSLFPQRPKVPTGIATAENAFDLTSLTGTAAKDGAAAEGGGILGAVGGIKLSAVAGLTTLVLALAAAETAAAVSASEHARSLRNLAEEMGTTQRNARQLEGAARITGVDIGTINAGMRQLLQGEEESGGRGKGINAVLQENKINPFTSTGGLKDTKDQLIEISNIVRQMNDTEARDLLERLFGRGGRNALPLLKQDLGALLQEVDGFNSALDNPALEKFSETMSKLALKAEGLVAWFAKPLVLGVDFASSPRFDAFWKFIEEHASNIAAGGGNAVPPQHRGFVGPSLPLPEEISDRRDFKVGDAARNKFLSGLDDTKEGLERIIQADKEKLTTLFNQLTPGHELKPARESQLETDYASTQAKTTADEARLKALTAKDQIPTLQLELDKRAETAERGDLYGYNKINQEAKDQQADLLERLQLKSKQQITEVPPGLLQDIERVRVAQTTREDERVRKAEDQQQYESTRTISQADIRYTRTIAGSDQVLQKAQQRTEGIETPQSIEQTRTSSISAAYVDYNEAQKTIAQLQKSLLDAKREGRPSDEIAKIQSTISNDNYLANLTKIQAIHLADNTAQMEGLKVEQERAKLAVQLANSADHIDIKRADAADKNQLATDHTIRTLEGEQTQRQLADQLELLKAGVGRNSGGRSRGGALVDTRDSIAQATESVQVRSSFIRRDTALQSLYADAQNIVKSRDRDLGQYQKEYERNVSLIGANPIETHVVSLDDTLKQIRDKVSELTGKVQASREQRADNQVAAAPSAAEAGKGVNGTIAGTTAPVVAAQPVAATSDADVTAPGLTDAIKNAVRAAAQKFTIPESLILAVAQQESGFKPTAVSPKGATGVMQLMPATAAHEGVTDRKDPAQNIEGGSRYLRELLDQYKGDVPKALTAYNGGPGSVTRQEHGGTLAVETQQYVPAVLRKQAVFEKEMTPAPIIGGAATPVAPVAGASVTASDQGLAAQIQSDRGQTPEAKAAATARRIAGDGKMYWRTPADLQTGNADFTPPPPANLYPAGSISNPNPTGGFAIPPPDDSVLTPALAKARRVSKAAASAGIGTPFSNYAQPDLGGNDLSEIFSAPSASNVASTVAINAGFMAAGPAVKAAAPLLKNALPEFGSLLRDFGSERGSFSLKNSKLLDPNFRVTSPTIVTPESRGITPSALGLPEGTQLPNSYAYPHNQGLEIESQLKKAGFKGDSMDDAHLPGKIDYLSTGYRKSGVPILELSPVRTGRYRQYVESMISGDIKPAGTPETEDIAKRGRSLFGSERGSFSLAPKPETGPPSEAAPDQPTLYHGSPRADLGVLQPGTMLTDRPEWSAGYTTRINPDSSEDFVGRVYAARPTIKNPLEASSLHGAEQQLIDLANTTGKPYTGLKGAAELVHREMGHEGIVARNTAGAVTGAIPFTATPVAESLDPRIVLNQAKASGRPIATNMETALSRTALLPDSVSQVVTAPISTTPATPTPVFRSSGPIAAPPVTAPAASRYATPAADFMNATVATAQRGAPESAMLRVQMANGGGVLNPIVEHVGDLTHRMSEGVTYNNAGYENVKDKVDKTLRTLTNPYGFRREMEENIDNNAAYRNEPAEPRRAKVYGALDQYAAEHSKVPVFNEVQGLARDAAVNVGNRDFDSAIEKLKKLQEYLNQGLDVWVQKAHEVDPGKVKAYQETGGKVPFPAPQVQPAPVVVNAPPVAGPVSTGTTPAAPTVSVAPVTPAVPVVVPAGVPTLPALPAATPEARNSVDEIMEMLGFGAGSKSTGTPAPAADLKPGPAPWRPQSTPQLDNLINARNSVYHTTSPENLDSILANRQLVPRGTPLPGEPLTNEAAAVEDNGVSVSRIPRIGSGAGKQPISFVLDQDKIPSSRPYVDYGTGKTQQSWTSVSESGPRIMNPAFETENRTYDKSVPLSAANGVLVDKEALAEWQRKQSRAAISPNLPPSQYVSQYNALETAKPEMADEALKDILPKLDSNGLRYKIFDTGREMSQYRAGLSQLPKSEQWGLPLAIGAAGATAAGTASDAQAQTAATTSNTAAAVNQERAEAEAIAAVRRIEGAGRVYWQTPTELQPPAIPLLHNRPSPFGPASDQPQQNLQPAQATQIIRTPLTTPVTATSLAVAAPTVIPPTPPTISAAQIAAQINAAFAPYLTTTSSPASPASPAAPSPTAAQIAPTALKAPPAAVSQQPSTKPRFGSPSDIDTFVTTEDLLDFLPLTPPTPVTHQTRLAARPVASAPAPATTVRTSTPAVDLEQLNTNLSELATRSHNTAVTAGAPALSVPGTGMGAPVLSITPDKLLTALAPKAPSQVSEQNHPAQPKLPQIGAIPGVNPALASQIVASPLRAPAASADQAQQQLVVPVGQTTVSRGVPVIIVGDNTRPGVTFTGQSVPTSPFRDAGQPVLPPSVVGGQDTQKPLPVTIALPATPVGPGSIGLSLLAQSGAYPTVNQNTAATPGPTPVTVTNDTGNKAASATTKAESDDKELMQQRQTLAEQQNNRELSATEQLNAVRTQLLQAYAAQQQEADEAHAKRVQESLEMMRAQNQAVQDVGGSLISAYIQAELHRQSGSFPLREALGQQYLKYGEQIGKNATGLLFGYAQKAGVGQHDIFPGISRSVPDPNREVYGGGPTTIDPATGLPITNDLPLSDAPAPNTGLAASVLGLPAGIGSAQKQVLTPFGKIYDKLTHGTPLAHVQAPVTLDKTVVSIESLARSIDETLKKMSGKQDALHPDNKQVPGSTQVDPQYVTNVPDPTGSASGGGMVVGPMGNTAVNIPGSGLPGLSNIAPPAGAAASSAVATAASAGVAGGGGLLASMPSLKGGSGGGGQASVTPAGVVSEKVTYPTQASADSGSSTDSSSSTGSADGGGLDTAQHDLSSLRTDASAVSTVANAVRARSNTTTGRITGGLGNLSGGLSGINTLLKALHKPFAQATQPFVYPQSASAGVTGLPQGTPDLDEDMPDFAPPDLTPWNASSLPGFSLPGFGGTNLSDISGGSDDSSAIDYSVSNPRQFIPRYDDQAAQQTVQTTPYFSIPSAVSLPSNTDWDMENGLSYGGYAGPGDTATGATTTPGYDNSEPSGDIYNPEAPAIFTAGTTETVNPATSQQQSSAPANIPATPTTLSTIQSVTAPAAGVKFVGANNSTGSAFGDASQNAVAAVGVVNDVVTGLKQIHQDFSGANGSSGAGSVFDGLSAVASTVAKVASAIPGGQLVAAGAEVSALVLGGIGAIFGDPRTARAQQDAYYGVQHTWTAPSAYNLVTTTNGQNATLDTQGNERGTAGPLLAYPNTSSYTIGYDYTFNKGYGAPLPGGVNPVQSTVLSLEIKALDSKSVLDNSYVIASAVHAAINNGHPIQNAIHNVANPR